MNEGGTKSYNIWEKICRWFWDRLKAMGESLYDYFIDDYEADEHRWGCFWIVVVIVILGCLGGCVRSCIREDKEEDAKREAWVKSNYKIDLGSLLDYPDTTSGATFEEIIKAKTTDTSYCALTMMVRSKKDEGMYLLNNVHKDCIIFVDKPDQNKLILDSWDFATYVYDGRTQNDPIRFINNHPDGFGKLYIYIPKDSIPNYIHGTIFIVK